YLAGAGGELRGAPAPAGPPAYAAGVVFASDTLREPRSVYSDPVTHLLDVRMQVVQARLGVPLDSPATAQYLRAYNLVWANGRAITDGPSYPGPSFHVRPGDRVRLRLVNKLSTSADSVCMPYPAADTSPPVDTFPDCFHGPNYTNIHYHGFHVTPGGTGDNVLIQIAPGDSFQYDFRIPPTQSSGTMWYHPHKHGSVALQVNNAMAGAFIVEGGGLDSLTRAYGMRDRLVAVEQVDSQVNLVDNVSGFKTLVNGQSSPVIPMRPGEVMRLRIVNENISRAAGFSVFFPSGSTQPQLYDVARDGVQYAPANYDTIQSDTVLNIFPGNRLDVFVRAPAAATSGTFELRARRVQPLGRSRKVELRADARGPGGGGNISLVRFQVVAAGAAAYNTRLPGRLPVLPYFLRNVGRITSDTAVVVFTDQNYDQRNPTPFPTSFYLGTAANHYMKYDPDTVYIPRSATNRMLPMVVGDSQVWKVMNYGISANHPFHIHINPFQVVRVVAPNAADPYAAYYRFLNQAAAGGNPIWSDVLPLPLADTTSGGTVTTPGYIVIKQRYLTFSGEFVMHCHILGHEERGMMQNLYIFPTLAAARAGRTNRVKGAHMAH
ncbi:MAG: L-ascorbate oxidase, partial [Gemmatimonadetes bacterium]|nr:L-ascorbate oxidase [Gemmatimonadota bacterium]